MAQKRSLSEVLPAITVRGTQDRPPGQTGDPLLPPGLCGDQEWIAAREWGQREGVNTLPAQPLVFRGGVLGVRALFDRGMVGDKDFE